jgi:hypothetical protein
MKTWSRILQFSGALAVLWLASPASADDTEPTELESTFDGRVLFEVASLGVSASRHIVIGLRFDADRSHVEISAFPAITTDPFDTPFGSSTSTITLIGGGSGSFDPVSGDMQIPVTLHFDQSLRIPFVNPDVDSSVVLSTASDGGAALASDSGDIALAATGSFSGKGLNPLDGVGVRFVISGALDPHP